STTRATSSGVRPMIFRHKSGRLIERSIVMPSLFVFVSVHYACFSESSHAPPRLTQRMPWFGVLVTRLTCQEKVTLSPFGWTSLTARHWGHSITVPRAVAWRRPGCLASGSRALPPDQAAQDSQTLTRLLPPGRHSTSYGIPRP